MSKHNTVGIEWVVEHPETKAEHKIRIDEAMIEFLNKGGKIEYCEPPAELKTLFKKSKSKGKLY